MPERTVEPLRIRVAGLFRAPRRTFERLAAAPRAFDVLTLGFAASAAAGALLFSTDVGQLALVDFWERTAAAFGRPVGDAEYAAMVRAGQQGAVLWGLLMAIATGPLLAVILAALVRATLPATAGSIPSYRQVLAVTAHAGLILALRQVVATPLSYARESLASPGTLNPLFGMLDEGSLPARFLGAFDLFVVWWIVVVAVGLSVLYRRPASRLALGLAGVYVALALALALVMAAAGGSA